MLVLTRKYQEKIRIGENITITVLRTKGKAVRLGIEAPSDVPVIRGELSFAAAEEDSEMVDAVCGEESTSSVKTRKRARGADALSTWMTESPHLADRSGNAQPAVAVSLKRVPRSEVAAVLPKLVSGSAPLRSMMNQR